MKFFLFVFLVTVGAVSQNVLFKVLSQPRLFANTLTSISPGEAQQNADEIRELIKTGEEERKVVTDNLNAAQSEFDVAKSKFDDATSKRTDKENEITAAQRELSQLQSNLVEQTATLESANNEVYVLTKVFENAKTHMDNENVRIDNEKAVFNTVIDKVQKLGSDASVDMQLDVHQSTITPSLIDVMTTANPEAVQKLLEALNKAVEAGEVARTKAQGALSTATQNLNDARDKQKNAQDDVDATTTAIGDKESDISTFQDQLKVLESIEAEARGIHNEKTIIRDDKKDIFDSETERIDGELKTFQDAIEALEKLDLVVTTLS